LTNDQMIGAGMPFDARNLDRLTVPWMERVSNDHLDRQIPGSMTLLPPAAARVISRPPSASP
jgi:hypothetical protein